MRPRHARVLVVSLLIACGGGLLVVRSSPVRAERPAVVLFREPESSELFARVRGQTRDLAIDLRSVAAAEALRTAGSDAARGALLAEHGARGAVWIEPSANESGYEVFVARAPDGRAHARIVRLPEANDGDALAQSAALEQLAIVVRGELSALLAEQSSPATVAADATGAAEPALSTAPAERVDDASHAAAAAETDAAAAAAAAEAKPSVESAATHDALSPLGRVRSYAGWELSWVGSEHLAHALCASGSVAFDSLELAFGVALGLPAELEASSADARVSRHAATLALYYGAPLANRLHVSVGARAGALLFARSTEGLDPALVKTAADTRFALGVGPSGLLRLRLTGGFGLSLSLSADVVVGAPRYTVQYAGSRLEIARARPLEPGVSLGAFGAF